MSRTQNNASHVKRGFFGVALYCPHKKINIGTMVRSANIMGANFLAIIGVPYQHHPGDTLATPKHVPTYEYQNFEDFLAHLPIKTQVIGIEITEDAKPLKDFQHPERAVYVIGSERLGLPPEVLARCHQVVKLEGRFCYNMAVAGSIVLYHRVGL